jgi:hypothetical protein
MVVKRWLARGRFRLGDAICELEVDGESRIVKEERMHPDDWGGIYWYFVDEGAEVGPRGLLLEFGDCMGGRSLLHSSARRKLVRRANYPQIFLSYRRDDAEAYAGRLHEKLSRTFGPDAVFMDLFGIRPGEVFPWTIQQAVVHADVVLALVGPRWLNISASGQKPRLEDPRDYVRREICAALDRGTLLIPVLLPGGIIPDPHSLPDDLGGLEELQFHELSARHWDTDVEHLSAIIRDHLEGTNQRVPFIGPSHTGD